VSFIVYTVVATDSSPSMTSSTAIPLARSDMEGLLGRGVSVLGLTGWVVGWDVNGMWLFSLGLFTANDGFISVESKVC